MCRTIKSLFATLALTFTFGCGSSRQDPVFARHQPEEKRANIAPEVLPENSEPQPDSVAIAAREKERQAIQDEIDEINQLAKEEHREKVNAFNAAKRDYDALRQINLAMVLYRDGKEKVLSAKSKAEGQKLLGFARQRFEQIDRDFPNTEGAKLAKEFLSGRESKIPQLPREPKQPQQPVYLAAADFEFEEEIKRTGESAAPLPIPGTSPQPTSSLPSNPSRMVSSGNGRVFVRGYYRKDGTYVRPHTRSR